MATVLSQAWRTIYLPYTLPVKRDSNSIPRPSVSKSAIIGISVATTVIVLALIAGGIFWLIRRRKAKKSRIDDRSGHGHARAIDEDDISHLNERSSKVPLIRHEEENQMIELRHSISRHEEDDEGAPLAMPRRTHSDATERSLLPSYASATHALAAGLNHTPSGRSSHRPGSSIGGSRGLRPLSLVEAHRDDDHSHTPQTSPERQNHRNRLSIQLPAHGRSRSTSRFREEDLDL